MRNRIGIVELNCSGETFDGQIKVALFAMNQADMGQDFRIVGLLVQGGFKFAQGIGQAVEMIVYLAELEMDDRILRVGLKDTAVEAGRIFHFSREA